MSNNLLLTLGCSWTEGVGVSYKPGMSRDEYQKIWKQDCDQYSFRSLISNYLGFKNINFAQAGSSNQRQFRLARDFFIDQSYNRYDKIIVLWGITSTARSEMYDNQKKEYENFFYHEREPWVLARMLLKHSYDHDNEVEQLSRNMQFWDTFFSSKNIDNHWFDTFNTHDYVYTNKFRMIDVDRQHRDLLSQLCYINNIKNIDNNYHLSNWISDSNRLSPLVELGVLNPYSFHPTVLGHQQLADFFIKKINF